MSIAADLNKIYINNGNGVGMWLSLGDVYQIHRWYEAACTAEYMLENEMIPEDEALSAGYEVRQIMDKYWGDEEEEAINEYLRRKGA